MTIINIFHHFVQNRYFGKFWPKSRISDNFKQNRDFSKILTKIEVVVNFDPNRDFLRFWLKSYLQTKIDTFLNFDQNREFSTSLIKIEIFRQIWPNLRFLENGHQNRYFQKCWPKSGLLPKSTFFGNFDPNEDLGKILTQIDFTEDID